MQVPPSGPRSISATCHPRSARRCESGLPAWPEPMTIASKSMGSVSWAYGVIANADCREEKKDHVTCGGYAQDGRALRGGWVGGVTAGEGAVRWMERRPR